MWSRRVLWGMGLGVPTVLAYTVLAYTAWAQPLTPPAPPLAPAAAPTAAPTATPTAAPTAAPSAGPAADDPPPALPPPAPVGPVPLVPRPAPPGPRQQQRRPPPRPYGYGYGYGYPYGYGYGRYKVPYQPPRSLPYQQGQPPPDGYELDTRMRKGFIIAGATTFGATYLLSVAVGGALQQDSDGEGYGPLFVPIVGPFITTGTVDASAFGTFALIVDGMTQTFGLGMLIFGAADAEKIWVRKELAVDVTPLFVDGELTGAGVRGEF